MPLVIPPTNLGWPILGAFATHIITLHVSMLCELSVLLAVGLG